MTIIGLAASGVVTAYPDFISETATGELVDESTMAVRQFRALRLGLFGR
jgi:hypothetical protein